jgi:hypothetical protein
LRVEGDTNFVEQAYMTLLKRPADPEGIRHYTGLIRDEGISRESVLESLRDSDEFDRLSVKP